MPIYVVVTYDLTDSNMEEVPLAVSRLAAGTAEVVVAMPDQETPEAAERGVTVVLEFASEAEADAWAARGDAAPIRHVWVHPLGQAPALHFGERADRPHAKPP